MLMPLMWSLVGIAFIALVYLLRIDIYEPKDK